MTTYRYEGVAISNLPIVATRIARNVGVVPTGLNDSGSTTEVMFSAALTAPQKTALDALMTGANADVIPTTTNTIYEVGTVEAIRAASGLDCDFYPIGNDTIRIVFTKQLTNAEKNSLRGAFTATFTLIQG